MNRLGFLKSIGVAVLAPSVLVPDEYIGYKEMPKPSFKPKRWPIYPEFTHFGYKTAEGIVYQYMTYVKVLRGREEYLVFVREECFSCELEDVININRRAKQRFEYNVRQVQDKYTIPENVEFLMDKGLLLKYNKSLHTN